MPTYEYACRDCGEHLEVVQSFKDDALTTCPNCSGNLRKVFSAAGIIFKGSGWHVKDYASSNRSGSSGGDSSDNGKESSGDTAGASKASGESDATTKASDASTSGTSSKSSAGKKPAATEGRGTKKTSGDAQKKSA